MTVSQFKFRGRRTYLHSTTVLNWILMESGATGLDMDFRFNVRTGRQVTFLDRAPPPGSQMIGRYTDRSVKLYLVESAQNIVGSEPYAEEEIGRQCVTGGNAVVVPCRLSGFTAVESVVTGYKVLLERLFPDRKGKFAFARLQWTHQPDGMIDVLFRRRISGQLYEGMLQQRGEPLGVVIFGEWQ